MPLRRCSATPCLVLSLLGLWLIPPMLSPSLAPLYGQAAAKAPEGPSEESRSRMAVQATVLQKAADSLRATPETAPQQVVDVAVFAKAVDWILRHDEFYKPSFEKDAQEVLKAGMERANQMKSGKADWGRTPGRKILAYRSRVDGSIQPYAISLPKGFRPGGNKEWPLYVVLHGRGGQLNEVSFIRQHDGKPPEDGQTWIQLDVFGRVNNAYRWAGETDVFEALEDVKRRYRIDDRRITLWGFSMGGAGAWHLGLHHPSMWSSVGAGAGFVDYYKYLKKEDGSLPAWQDRTLRIYDATNYALNLADVPTVTYGGEIDPQLAASLIMQELAKEQKVSVDVIIGPKMGHKFDDESKQKFMDFHAMHSKAGRPESPGRLEIQFTTSTLKYNRCDWLTIEEIDQCYEPSVVKSQQNGSGELSLTTKNVTALAVDHAISRRVKIDDAEPVFVSRLPSSKLTATYFVKESGQWKALSEPEAQEFLENRSLHKRHDLQGPIDDAFMESFVCVRGTGTPWAANHQAWADWTLTRFEQEFDKWMRAKAPVIKDDEVTDDLIRDSNLVLFGDPGSNKLLAKIVDRLPLEWEKDRIRINGKEYSTADHGVCLIYPNPLNPKRYVVINSGHSVHEPDFKGTNALLFPKLGDVAVQKFEKTGNGFTETTVWADSFDARWKFPSNKSAAP